MRKNLLLCSVLLTCLAAVALDRQPNADYRARRVALSHKTDGGVVLLFASTEKEGHDTTGYRQDDDFFYLTGWSQPGAALLIAPEASAKDGNEAHPYTEIFFLPEHNRTEEHWTGPKLGPEDADARQVTGFDRVDSLDNMAKDLVKILPHPRVTMFLQMGPNAPSNMPFAWLERANAFATRVIKEDVDEILTPMRMVKDRGEMERIQHAVDASVAAHLAAMKAIKPGMKEYEIAALIQYEYERRGCARPAYASIVGSGYSGTVLHYSEDSGTIQDGDDVVIDAAGEYADYASDITRTLPANGKFTPRQREIYDIVLGAQRAAAAAFVPGKSILYGPGSLTDVAKQYIDSHGKDLHGDPLGKYFIHGVGHQVGLNVHDADNRAPLDRGMVFTIEPGIYIREEKIGVRIEDMFWVDPDGKLVRLTAKLPQTADDVERAMAAR